MTAATPGSVAVMMMLLLMFACQSDDKNEGAKNVDDGEEGSHHVPAAAVPAGSDAAGITPENLDGWLIATDTAQADHKTRAKKLSVDCCLSAAPPKRRGTLAAGAPATTGMVVCSETGRASQQLHDGCDCFSSGREGSCLRPAEDAGHPRSSRVLGSMSHRSSGRPPGGRRAGECECGRKGSWRLLSQPPADRSFRGAPTHVRHGPGPAGKAVDGRISLLC